MKQLSKTWIRIRTVRGVIGLFVAAILSLSCMTVQAFDPAKIVDGNGAMDSAYELPDAASIERAKKKVIYRICMSSTRRLEIMRR